ncbi:hypothetical protein OIV83_004623 [Microbotryomycetes sp. JL201]|nr:hypothetical protein OIV83_004623 [Microbotryomycetes sp. JL201]
MASMPPQLVYRTATRVPQGLTKNNARQALVRCVVEQRRRLLATAAAPRASSDSPVPSISVAQADSTLASPLVSPLPPPPEPEQAYTAPAARVRRPVGAFRGGLIGFLLGSTIVGLIGYTQLLDTYTKHSAELSQSISSLRASIQRINSEQERIATLEQQTKQLVKDSSLKRDVDALRREFKSLHESEHLDHVELRARVWAIEQDIQLLLKSANSSVRI